MPPEIDLTADLADDAVIEPGGSGASGAHTVQPPEAGNAPPPDGTVRHGDTPGTIKSKAVSPAAETSLRDELSAAFKGEAGDVTGQADAANAGRPRNPDGTFKSQADIDAEAAAAAQQAPVDPAAAAAQAAQPVQVPRSLDAAAAQQFAQLPAEMQQFVARTMEGVEARAAQLGEYTQIEQLLIGPRREAWALNGMTPVTAVNQLFALSDFATRDPEGFLLYFAEQQGVDLAMLANDDTRPPVDPEIQQLQQHVGRLEQALNGFTTGQQQQQHSAIVAEVAAFSDEKGADGNPLRPYFVELGDALFPHLQQVMAQNPNWSRTAILSEAYDRACWATSSVRAKLLAAQDAERLAQAGQRAGAARHAGSSVTGAPADGRTAAPGAGDDSIRGELQRQFAAARGDV